MKHRILIVDDDASLRAMLTSYLREHGNETQTAANGREALFAARSFGPDVVLLDVMMPELDGFEFIRNFRKESNAPVILLTARVDESDKVYGLDLGADDYLTKPFGMKELLARIRAIARRSAGPREPGAIATIGDITIDRSAHGVNSSGKNVDLTPTEYKLLDTLISAPGRAFSRNALLEQLREFDSDDGGHRTVDVHIRNLRMKIEPDPSHPRYILTVYGVGYRFAED